MPSPLDLLMRVEPVGRMAGLRRTVEPNNTLFLSTVKSHLKITSTAEDALLQIYINAATRYIEQMSRRSLLTQTWKLTLDNFPNDDKLELFNGPVQSITSFTTYALDNTPDAAFADYVVDAAGDRVLLNNGSVWPTNIRTHAAVEIVYVTGYGAAITNIPQTLLQAVLKLVGNFYINRDIACNVTPEMAFGVSDLIAGERRWRL